MLPSKFSDYRRVRSETRWYSDIYRIRRSTWRQWVAPALGLSPRWEVRGCACGNYELSVEGGVQDTKNIRYTSDSVMFLHVKNIWEL